MSEFMMVCQKIHMHMDAYRAQQQGYGHPLTIIMSRKVRKEAKPHGEKSSLKIGQGIEFEMCLQHIFIFTLMS